MELKKISLEKEEKAKEPRRLRLNLKWKWIGIIIGIVLLASLSMTVFLGMPVYQIYGQAQITKNKLKKHIR